MTKKDILALADLLRSLPRTDKLAKLRVICEVAELCERLNTKFNKLRFFDYINGKCGPNGGKK